jgi:hypothetical protein
MLNCVACSREGGQPTSVYILCLNSRIEQYFNNSRTHTLTMILISLEIDIIRTRTCRWENSISVASDVPVD